MNVSRRFGVGVAVASLFAGLAVFGSLDQAVAHRENAHSPRLVERATCAEAKPPSTVPQQNITVVVPPIALLRVDKTGRVFAVATNTGCAPRIGDQLFVVRGDGSISVTRLSKLTQRRWVGDFTAPGVYVAQRGGEMRVADRARSALPP
jgi:hypothetical protein